MSWLGLLALVLQLALTAGHIHADGVLGRAMARGPSVADGTADPQRPEDRPALPHRHDCPICSSLQSAGSALVPLAPSVDEPAPFASEARTGEAELALSQPAFSLFRTRAPPIS